MSNETWRLVYAHVVLIIGVIFMSFPVWVAFATSTHDSVTILRNGFAVLAGHEFP